MHHVGAFEAKTNLSALLQRVEQGERIVITKHGRAVALLVPPQEDDRREALRETVEAIHAFRRGRTLGGLTAQELRDEGRR